MNNLLIRKFLHTHIGEVKCSLFSSCEVFEKEKEALYENGISVFYKTSGHIIELIEFTLKENSQLVDSCGWIFRIQKVNEQEEELMIKCQISSPIGNLEFSSDSGENLDAISGYNQEWELHIGTEDGEIMNSRAVRDDWLPNRLESKVDLYKPITHYLEDYSGLYTPIPQLFEKEKLHIQYLAAITERNDNDVISWLAVEKTKRELYNWVGIGIE